MYLSTESQEEHFAGFNIVDCTVRSKDILYFVLREDYTSRPDWSEDKEPPPESKLLTRVVNKFLDEPEPESWSHQNLNGFEYLLAGCSNVPKEQFVGVDISGQVYVLGDGDDEIEALIPPWDKGGPRRGAFMKEKNIAGSLYICGGNRSVGKRSGRNKWQSWTKEIKTAGKDGEGFEDIDGFSESDIYCVGGKGEVWHYNGKSWKQVHFPSNINLYTVCCAGDGQVYISGYGGTTFKGRDDAWKQIHKAELSLPFRDMVWYEDKIWCTNDYGIWTIEDEKLGMADLASEIVVCSGNLSVADGLLLVAGYNGAAFKLNGSWNVIF
jgi:hypothetical protein